MKSDNLNFFQSPPNNTRKNHHHHHCHHYNRCSCGYCYDCGRHVGGWARPYNPYPYPPYNPYPYYPWTAQYQSGGVVNQRDQTTSWNQNTGDNVGGSPQASSSHSHSH